MLTKLEKEFLVFVIDKEKEYFEKRKKSLMVDMPVQFLKAEHEYSDFLDNLKSKLDG